jgi:uncharacterized protein YgbK (DUF1537 family)
MVIGLAVTLADAAALATVRGPGARIGSSPDSDILAPLSGTLAALVPAAIGRRAAQYVVSCGNAGDLPAADMLAPMIEDLIAGTGTGFCAACLADPASGRTVYQGHFFTGSRLRADLIRDFGAALRGRAAIVPHGITAAGPAAIRRRLTALKDQGVALALIDAIDEADCAAVSAGMAGQPVIAGPAWITGAAPAVAEPPPPDGPLAILAGATDRQTLFQIGAASAAMPVLQLDFSRTDTTAHALAWAGERIGEPFLIAASAPPGRLDPAAPVHDILGGIAAALGPLGITRLVIAGSDTAAAILAHLGETALVAGTAAGPFRWLRGAKFAYLLKPGSAGGRDLFLAGFGPQIRLNAAAE